MNQEFNLHNGFCLFSFTLFTFSLTLVARIEARKAYWFWSQQAWFGRMFLLLSGFVVPQQSVCKKEEEKTDAPSRVAKRPGSWVFFLGSRIIWLCDLRHMTLPLWISISLYVKLENNLKVYLLQLLLGLNDVIYIRYSRQAQHIIDSQCFNFLFLIIYFYLGTKINIWLF